MSNRKPWRTRLQERKMALGARDCAGAHPRRHRKRSPNSPKTQLPDSEPTISVYMHETGRVKNMPLETYLEGVVAAEMDPTWPLEALRAQAIVARTFTLKKMSEGGVPKRGTQASTDPAIISGLQRRKGQR